MKKNSFFAKLFAILLTSIITILHSQTYCNPTYTNGCELWRITQVTIPEVSFDNTFGSGTCITGRDRTSVIINLTTNTNYTINVSTKGWISCGMAIDFNKDGDFDDTGEALFLPTYIGLENPTYTGNFTIPSSITAGNYRMRVWNRIANSGGGTPTADSPCATYDFGTWTDYTVNLAQLSTAEIILSTAKFYPNPVFDVLNIEDVQNIRRIEIHDLNGKLVKDIHPKNSKNISLCLAELCAGIYIANIIHDKENQSVKFIKR